MSAGGRAAAAFVLGAVIMLAFDAWPLRVAGLALMLGGVVLSVFAIASPEFLREDRRGGAGPGQRDPADER